MKSIVLSSVVIALVVFTGCSDKEPAVDDKPSVEKPAIEEKEKVAEKIEDVKTEIVSSEDSLVDSGSEALSSSEIADNITMSLSDIQNQFSTVYFAFDKFNISSDMQTNITGGAEIINKSSANFNIKLEGNCDEWGSDEYNFALGLKRANAVKKALVAEGIDSSLISMVSYGESNPTCTDKTSECYAKNRRVDFTLLP